MEFGDDYNSVLSDRQWKIYYEIYFNYRLNEYVTEIVQLLLNEVIKDMKEWGDGKDNENEIKAWWCTDSLSDLFYNEVYAEHINLDKKNKLFGQHGTLKLPKIIQGKYRVYKEPNLCGGENYVEDINPNTKEEAYKYFIDVYENYYKKFMEQNGDIETWNRYFNSSFYLRDNSTGEILSYEHIKKNI